MTQKRSSIHPGTFSRIGAIMDVMDAGTYLKTLACACNNKGAAVWLGAGSQRRLHDLDGDFHHDGRDDDPSIVCDVCGRVIPA